MLSGDRYNRFFCLYPRNPRLAFGEAQVLV
jgi:hypothetical protein